MEKNSRASKIFESLKKFNCTETLQLKDTLTLSQLANLSYHLDNDLDKTNEFYAIDFNEKFNVVKEKSNYVSEFEHSELSYRLLLEEVLEYVFSTNLDENKVFSIFLELYKKEIDKPNKNKTNEEKLISIYDALTDILVITYGRFHVLNSKEISNELMEEVYNSNMSKMCKTEEELKATVQKYFSLGRTVKSEKIGNNFLVRDAKTNKVLKSVTYQEPDIKKILKQFKII